MDPNIRIRNLSILLSSVFMAAPPSVRVTEVPVSVAAGQSQKSVQEISAAQARAPNCFEEPSVFDWLQHPLSFHIPNGCIAPGTRHKREIRLINRTRRTIQIPSRFDFCFFGESWSRHFSASRGFREKQSSMRCISQLFHSSQSRTSGHGILLNFVFSGPHRF